VARETYTVTRVMRSVVDEIATALNKANAAKHAQSEHKSSNDGNETSAQVMCLC